MHIFSRFSFLFKYQKSTTSPIFHCFPSSNNGGSVYLLRLLHLVMSSSHLLHGFCSNRGTLILRICTFLRVLGLLGSGFEFQDRKSNNIFTYSLRCYRCKTRQSIECVVNKLSRRWTELYRGRRYTLKRVTRLWFTCIMCRHIASLFIGK